MRLPNPFRSFLLLLGMLAGCAGSAVYAQKTDSLSLRLAALVRERNAHILKDTDYLRAVDSIAPLLEQADSLPYWLSTYRDIAFADPHPGRHRANYYTWLALNAYNTNKFGTAIYYSEKNNEERVNAGIFEKGGLAHSDMFALFVYFNNHDYHRIMLKYLPLRAVLAKMPAGIAAGKVSAEQAFVALSILQVAVFTYGKTGDTLHMHEALQVAAAIFEKMRQRTATYAVFRAQFAYLQHSIGFQEQCSSHHFDEAGRLLDTAIDDVLDRDFPASMRADYSYGLYSQAVDFYVDLRKRDSVRYYLTLLHSQGNNAFESTADTVFLAAHDGYLLADEGHYEDAYRQLRKAFQLRDSAYYSVSSDRDNNLYALAEAENARAEQLRSEEQKRAAERSNLILLFLLILFMLGGGIAFVYYRQRQHQRSLNVQLGLARNFHDAIGPMLIYANALVKKEMDDHASPRLTELKSHIGLLMTEVRSISHDLKSNRFDTITGFCRDLTTTLEKLREATGISFTLKVENGERALSQLQLTHLSKIVHELVGNSVKHAECGKISLAMTGVKRNLQVHYSDDGKGINPETGPAGIGLENIRERVGTLRGSFRLDNAWPQGYSILILIPLL